MRNIRPRVGVPGKSQLPRSPKHLQITGASAATANSPSARRRRGKELTYQQQLKLRAVTRSRAETQLRTSAIVPGCSDKPQKAPVTGPPCQHARLDAIRARQIRTRVASYGGLAQTRRKRKRLRHEAGDVPGASFRFDARQCPRLESPCAKPRSHTISCARAWSDPLQSAPIRSGHARSAHHSNQLCSAAGGRKRRHQTAQRRVGPTAPAPDDESARHRIESDDLATVQSRPVRGRREMAAGASARPTVMRDHASQHRSSNRRSIRDRSMPSPVAIALPMRIR